MDYLQERVSTGDRFLDEHFPGWERKIDPKVLDMQDEEQCVLGLLFGDCSVALAQFDFSASQLTPLGFSALLEADFPRLSQLRKQLILERLSASEKGASPMASTAIDNPHQDERR